jgi:predicted dehydrogenase
LKQIRWGMLGCGDVTEKKSGPAFNKVEGSQVIAVMCRNADKAADYAHRHHIQNCYTSVEKLISNKDINAVYIATPPSSHAEYAIMALEHGKMVYVEKPMAANYHECERMSEASRKNGMPLYVAYYRRFLPYFLKVKEILNTGMLGKLLYVKVDFHIPPRKEDYNALDVPWRLKPEIAGGGYFYDMACHQIDLFDMYFGKTAEVWGRKINRRGLYEPEDLINAAITYESGLPLFATWCFAGDEGQHTDKITVYGSLATAEFATFSFSPIRVITASDVLTFIPPNPENIQYWFIKNMVEEMQGIKPLTVNTESAMRTNYIMDKILGKIGS